MSLESEAFDVLHESLSLVRPEFVGRAVILCPICLREITREQILAGGVEHIIPRTILKKDRPHVSSLGTRNQRAGITVLCRQARAIESDRSTAKHGCNGFKGSTYDWPLRLVMDDKPHTRSELTHRHGVAILSMAYMGAFQSFGYDYILRRELDEIRKQFDFPDTRVTDWLDHALYSSEPPSEPIIATELGLPFVFGGILSPTAPLHVIFRRCQAWLPQGHWVSRGVRSLESLLVKNPDLP